jgi:PPOX class probable F420-dependent enzyme
MGKQRDAVTMNAAELAVFLAETKTMVVATLGPDGWPHQTALWFAVRDGAYVFQTYATSQKILNLRRDPRISLHWEAGETSDQLRGASVQGLAAIVDGEAERTDLIRLCVARNAPQLVGAALEERVRLLARKRVAVVVTPGRSFSWDHRKLAGGY